MKKTLQKGFSLVELLVVVAIIGVLAGVGIVGYQSYTDSAKSRVAVANFNSVKRFVETELTLLNNNIQTVSGAISAGSSCSSLTPYTVYSNTLSDFVEGLTCYFATDGYGNAFKNPYDAAGGNQIVFSSAAADVKKGQVNVRFFPAADTTINGAVIPSGGIFAAGSTSGYFLVEYYTADGSAGSTGEYKAKEFQLK
ncbi:prepilin-type N-terminal cleavage/methylation domain-containing protein [Candidatus Pelagibacter ubique]|uniref:pilin n=1 Tax=Pelagibacter ubique TaxID=198252 RepID=UPI0003D1B045